MDPLRRQAANAAFVALALVHALLTWPLRPTAALFVGGAFLALVAEAVGVRLGLLDHRLRPQVAGVPLTVPLVWPTVAYVAYRVALLAAPAGPPAAAVAAVLATALDAATDPTAVREGVWRYPEHPLSEPRFRGVPWWNFAGWLGLTFLTALIPWLAGRP